MKLSAFTLITNPEKWCFPYEEALRNYCDLFDEVVVVDGGSTDGSLEKINKISDKIKIVTLNWPEEFKQREFPLHYNFGLENCTGDWAFKMDIDWLIHETDFNAFRNKLAWLGSGKEFMVCNLQKLSMLNRYEYHHKGKMTLGIHTKYYKGDIGMGVLRGSEGKCDWTNIIRIKEIKDGIPYGDPIDKIFDLGISFYNYDCIFRPKEKCKAWIQRASRAYLNETGFPLYGEGNDGAWEMWKGMMIMRKGFTHPHKLKIQSHPKHIQEKLTNMTPDMWGYENWNWDL